MLQTAKQCVPSVKREHPRMERVKQQLLPVRIVWWVKLQPVALRVPVVWLENQQHWVPPPIFALFVKRAGSQHWVLHALIALLEDGSLPMLQTAKQLVPSVQREHPRMG